MLEVNVGGYRFVSIGIGYSRTDCKEKPDEYKGGFQIHISSFLFLSNFSLAKLLPFNGISKFLDGQMGFINTC